MAHERKDLRDAIVTALTDETEAEDRVFGRRTVPFESIELPAISVHPEGEVIEGGDNAPRTLMRTVRMVVIGVIKANLDTIEDDLDALDLEIDQAMDADPNFGETAFDSVLTSVDFDFDSTGKRPLAAVRKVYTCKYETQAPRAADVSLPDDFYTANVKTRPNGAGVGDQLETTVTVQEEEP